tara:strand:+ start:1978 stop:2712 length:735 start_codon:yes stop_codon:yes gene_type:complete
MKKTSFPKIVLLAAGLLLACGKKGSNSDGADKGASEVNDQQVQFVDEVETTDAISFNLSLPESLVAESDSDKGEEATKEDLAILEQDATPEKQAKYLKLGCTGAIREKISGIIVLRFYQVKISDDANQPKKKLLEKVVKRIHCLAPIKIGVYNTDYTSQYQLEGALYSAQANQRYKGATPVFSGNPALSRKITMVMKPVVPPQPGPIKVKVIIEDKEEQDGYSRCVAAGFSYDFENRLCLGTVD